MNLSGFHAFLKKAGCNMPYDLLVKWPRRHAFIDALRDEEKEKLLAEMPDGVSNLMIFIIRDDAKEHALVEYIHQEIANKLTVLFSEKLTRDQINRALQLTRGGNWMEQDKKMFHRVEPHAILLCRPKTPFCSSQESNRTGDQIRFQAECSAIKNDLRQKINRHFSPQLQRYAIHSSDSTSETIDYLKAIYPDSYRDILNKIAESSC
jgi:hypothetical protein